jgi:hypothetical protein
MTLVRLVRVTVLDSKCSRCERTSSCDKDGVVKRSRGSSMHETAVFLATAPAVSHQTAVGVDSLSSAADLSPASPSARTGDCPYERLYIASGSDIQ